MSENLNATPAVDPAGEFVWRQIEAAPKDGTAILACRMSSTNKGWRFAVIHWRCHGFLPKEDKLYTEKWHLMVAIKGQTSLPDWKPTHWMPLPEAPQ